MFLNEFFEKYFTGIKFHHFFIINLSIELNFTDSKTQEINLADCRTKKINEIEIEIIPHNTTGTTNKE